MYKPVRISDMEGYLVNKVFEIYDNHGQLGLKQRDGQTDMSLDIMEAIPRRNNIMIEAGVGIGKSFGYLIPALLLIEVTGKPVVIATSSIQLSEQLSRDAKEISDKIGIKAKVVVGKGMWHYTCQAKAYKNMSRDVSNEKVQQIIKEVVEGNINERSDIKDEVSDKQCPLQLQS